jgi:hypothetical protein
MVLDYACVNQKTQLHGTQVGSQPTRHPQERSYEFHFQVQKFKSRGLLGFNAGLMMHEEDVSEDVAASILKSRIKYRNVCLHISHEMLALLPHFRKQEIGTYEGYRPIQYLAPQNKQQHETGSSFWRTLPQLMSAR